MSKYILRLAAIFILSYVGRVQAQQKGSLWINVITGINGTLILNQNAYGNPEMAYAPTVGFTGGMGVSYYHNYSWGLNGSVLASKLGQNYSGLQGGGEALRKVRLSYIEVPILIMKNIPLMKFPTWISFGPDMMFLFNAQQEYTREGGTPLQNQIGMATGDIKERFNSTDVVVNMSLNRMYTLNYFGTMMLLLSLNTAIGITDINSTEWQIPNTHNEYGKSHNFYMGIKAGIMFKVKRFGGEYW